MPGASRLARAGRHSRRTKILCPCNTSDNIRDGPPSTTQRSKVEVRTLQKSTRGGLCFLRLLLRVIHRGGLSDAEGRESANNPKQTQNCPGKRRTCERAMEREQNHSTKGPPCLCASLAELVLLMQHELRLLHTRVPSAPTKLVAACYIFALVCIHNTLDGLRRRNFASCGRDGRKGRGGH